MNSKDRMVKTLNGEKPDTVAVAPHWWGHYKFEIAGKNYITDWYRDGSSMVEIYAKFYETFKPDWFHLHGGTPGYYKYLRVKKEGDRFFLINPLGWEPPIGGWYDEILKDEFLYSQRRKPKLTSLESKQQIDEYLETYVKVDAESIIEAGFTDHIRGIVRQYGDEVFLAVHIGSPASHIFTPHVGIMGFEKTMIALVEQPELMKYLIKKVSQVSLEWAKAYAEAGCHAFIISESEFSSDLISPKMYERILFDIHQRYFRKISEMGMFPMLCFFGDINPLIKYINKIGIKALMVEENRKGFSMDILKTREALNEEITLFGNIDPYEVLVKGRPEDVEKAVKKQLLAAQKGRFIISNGSPLITGTPVENVKTMIEVARRYGKNPQY